MEACVIVKWATKAYFSGNSTIDANMVRPLGVGVCVGVCVGVVGVSHNNRQWRR